MELAGAVVGLPGPAAWVEVEDGKSVEVALAVDVTVGVSVAGGIVGMV